MEERQLSLSEVARVMGFSERTIRRWVKSGKLKAYKPGRDYRISEAALREFIEESEVSPKVALPLQLELAAAGEAEETAWKAEYEARVDDLLSMWEGELEEKMALAESAPLRFHDWVAQVRSIGRPLITGLISANTATGYELDAVLGVADPLGRYAGLWRRIQERIKEAEQIAEENQKQQMLKWAEEERRLASSNSSNG